jgi:hypothetical protein
MAIIETAAAASIITKILSLSTDLLERTEDRKTGKELREIQELLNDLQSFNLSLQVEVSKLHSQNTDLEKENLNLLRQKNKAETQAKEWECYKIERSEDKAVFYRNKTEPDVYACAVCRSKHPYPIILQPICPSSPDFICAECETIIRIHYEPPSGPQYYA